MRILFLDAETFDPSLKKYGTGSIFKYHYSEVDFEVLIFGYIDNEGNEGVCDSRTANGWATLLSLIKQHDAVVFHNALYDLSSLKYLFRDGFDSELKRLVVYDTMLMAKHYDQNMNQKWFSGFPYSLDSLCTFYKLGEQKQSDILHDYVWHSGIYQKHHLETTGRNCHTRPSSNILKNFCMSDLRRFPKEVLAEYCLQDIRATKALFEFLMPRLEHMDLTPTSDILKVCLDARFTPVDIDLTKARELSSQWLKVADDCAKEVTIIVKGKEDFNINSGRQLGAALEEIGYQIPRTDKGEYSIVDAWLDEQQDEVFKLIKRYRKSRKAEKDYIQKLIKYQEIIPEKYRTAERGKAFLIMKPFGAHATGRFTSGGGAGSLELNWLAISRKDEEFGLPIRGVIIAPEGYELCCLDFSNQEPRLQAHYAKLLQCDGVDEVIKAWHEDPKMKYHQKVADLTKLPYDTAKIVTLGLSYDMHAEGLSTKLKISFREAKQLMKQYHRLLPFMDQLHNRTMQALLKNKYIKTIGGRRLGLGKYESDGRKAMSKLIQGSGADQTMKAMIDAYKLGLKIVLAVHDEIIIITKQPEKDLPILNHCMENAYPLVVPVVTDGSSGRSWLDAK